MYSNNDILIIEKEFKKFLLFYILASLLFIIFLVALCRNWGTVLDPIRLPSWPAYVLGIVYVVCSVFSWNLIGLRLIKYRNFVYNILTGIARTVDAEIISISKTISYDKDLEYYSLEIRTGKDSENRKLYLDALKEIDDFKVGKKVKLKVFENYIKDVIS